MLHSFEDLVQQGISEKVPMSLQFVSSFIAGIIIAYTQSWRLALAMSSILPCIMLTGGLMGKFMARYTQCVYRRPLWPTLTIFFALRLSTDEVASAGTIAEETISTIRTAKAFGIQPHLSKVFDDKITRAGRSDMIRATIQGFGFAAFFFINYSAYGLGNLLHHYFSFRLLIQISFFLWDDTHQ